MQMAPFFTNNKTELGLTSATKNIIIEQKKIEEFDPYKLFSKKESQWTKKTK